MMSVILPLCYGGLFLASFFALIRLILGPTLQDRILAFDVIALSIAAIAILFSIQTSSLYFVEILFIYSLLGFTTVLGFMDYAEVLKQDPDKNKDKQEPEDSYGLD